MARRAPDPVEPAPAPASPPKRVTRARTKNAPTSSKSKEGTATKATASAVAKRGRPKKTDTLTRATAASKARTTSAAAARRSATTTKGGTRAKKEQEVVDDDDGTSSDDEMDVVTVRSHNSSLMGSRGSSRMGSTSSLTGSTGSMATRARRGATATATTATARRKAQAQSKDVDDDDDDEDELAQLEVSTGSARGNVATRPTRTATAPTAASRTRQAATTTTTRRTRKTATETSSESTGSLRSSGTGAAGKRATGPTSSSTSRNRPATVATAARKKVTFLDITEDSDKENQVVPPPATGMGKGKLATGMSAKPVRRGAASTATRATKTAATENAADTAPAKEPLSPKKATQVAKANSSGSEDAADSDVPSQPNTPVRHISKSPVKVGSISSALASPAKKLDFGASIGVPMPSPIKLQEEETEPTSNERDIIPFKEFRESFMASSPARRPPSSPYKDIMRMESPKKAPIIFEPKSPSPVKSTRDVMSSPLKDSPRKGKLAASISQFSASCGPAAASPLKGMSASFLRTPAKRAPMLSSSPLSIRSKRDSMSRMNRGSGMGLFGRTEEEAHPQEPSAHGPEDTEMTTEPDTPKPAEETPRQDDGYPEPLEIDESTLEIPPPETWKFEQNESPHQDEQENEPQDPEKALEELQREVDAEDSFVNSELSPAMFTAPQPCPEVPEASGVKTVRSLNEARPAAASPAFGYDYRDEAAETEGESMMDISPAKPRYPESPAMYPDCGDDELGFTPLASQLGQWNATSPDKRPAKKYPIPGLFSPVKVHSRRARDSLEGRHSIRARQSMASRASLAAGTPTLARLFDGEMKILVRGRERSDYEGSMLIDDESMNDVDITMLSHEPDMGHVEDQEPTEPFQVDDEVYADENEIPPEPTVTVPPNLFYEDRNNGNDRAEVDLQEDENISSEEPTVTIPATLFFGDKENDRNQNGSMPPNAHLPMSVTPVRGRTTPRTVHTVSKVPLKPEDDGSLRISRKRARSLSAGSSGLIPQLTPTPALKANTLPSPKKSKSPLKQQFDVEDLSEPTGEEEEVTPKPTRTRQSPVRSTPARSAKKPATNLVLQGAVVYADVHTMEGADASGIFIELLTQMGARCVKSWNWNPRTSLSPVDGAEPKETKVGITHVVYKDGGVRTLEKVREANGLVKCVGVGWVLDCERANKWLDEADYAVDLTMIPRGGQKRRKSMEPRALSNINGSVVKLDSSASSVSGRRTFGADEQEAAMQELRKLSPTPQSVRSRRTTVEFSMDDESGLATPRPQRRDKRQSSAHRARRSSIMPPDPDSTPRADQPIQPPATPSFDYDSDYTFNFNDDDNTISAPSPTTPFYLSERSRLVQQTCPPKQSRQGLFDSKPSGGSGSGSGAAGDEFTMSEGLRRRLEAARRKSLVWRPKVGSPLAKGI